MLAENRSVAIVSLCCELEALRCIRSRIREIAVQIGLVGARPRSAMSTISSAGSTLGAPQYRPCRHRDGTVHSGAARCLVFDDLFDAYPGGRRTPQRIVERLTGSAASTTSRRR